MSSNQDKIFARYSNKSEEVRADHSRTSALEFHYTKRHIDPYISKDSRVLEIGCATGYYGLYYADKCREYMGVDIYPPHIELFNKKIAEKRLSNVTCQVGDATNLNVISDGSFDVVLCLGPMYHLPPEERELVLAECSRICKIGGILAFAYINTIGVYAGACVFDDCTYPNEKTNDYVLNKQTDDVNPGLFYFTMPEEIETAAEKHGLRKIKNLGTNFMITKKIVDDMSDERFEVMRPLYDQMTSFESCTGISNHALLICQKT